MNDGVRIMDLTQKTGFPELWELVSTNTMGSQWLIPSTLVMGCTAVAIPTQSITWEHFTIFSQCESFKSYIASFPWNCVQLISGKANNDSTGHTRKLPTYHASCCCHQLHSLWYGWCRSAVRIFIPAAGWPTVPLHEFTNLNRSPCSCSKLLLTVYMPKIVYFSICTWEIAHSIMAMNWAVFIRLTWVFSCLPTL